ncbi:class I SAM-dependent methyltransferase [Umezawaea endophytica]|uniref:Class I SAM-dependent methyltransferase n=1 Tax=Umezawaea endophytica TaxID=1654476 RepID=A0A9X2VIK3_9PSEU|nr:class I SAM-dependent methyltransferase [Umezawaea endophytica]MCS7476769.1 class I SAM-dependent methyltransferase [Umezawaea endophytica]
MFDSGFHAAVAGLRVPAAGTDVVAPLLSSLVHLARPRRVLEVGMGYTTPFLAAALVQVAEQARAEASALAAKTARHLDSVGELDSDWLHADPALRAPGFYLDPYQPRFIAVDDLSIPDSSAGRVMDVLASLGLAEHVQVVNANIRECRALLPDDFTPIDLAWVDAWECLYFFDHFWDMINPDGGLLVMHYLMTYPEGEAILDYIAKVQRRKPGELEVLNLLEPHKMLQNSLTVIRRTSAGRARSFAHAGGHLDFDGRLRHEAETQAGRGTASA